MHLRVSVIIPNYNHALFLRQRIESALNQTYQDFEVILMDDASTDESRNIIESYRNHTKVSTISYNTINSGSVFKQWIKGLQFAKGELIWIAESDDLAAPGFLETCVAHLEQNSAADMVFTNSKIISSTGAKLGTTAEEKTDLFARLSAAGNSIIRGNAVEFLLTEMIISNASSVLFHKHAFQKIDLTKLAEFTNTGDRFVYLGIALQGRIHYVPVALNFMRLHGNNTTTSGFANGNIHRDRLKVLHFYFDELLLSTDKPVEVSRFYKNNFLSFLTHGETADNAGVLKKIYRSGNIDGLTYGLFKLYSVAVRRNRRKPSILQRILYRILLLKNLQNSDYQK